MGWNFRPLFHLIRKMSTTTEQLIFQDFGTKGVIILNRPKALNAMTETMMEKMHLKLEKWQNEKNLVIIKGAGGKAFCAGGDIKSLAIAGEKSGHTFFQHKYNLNHVIGSYKIPYISIIDGIIMGIGVGLASYGKYRVATEKSIFALPETQLGFFPADGGPYFLPNLRGKLGLFLALTGYSLKGSDLFKAGIATHFVDSENLVPLEADLLKCDNVEAIESTLLKYQKQDVKEFSLEQNMRVINECFSAKTVEEIIQKLERDNSEFSEKILRLLAKMSPSGLKLTMKQMELGAKLNLEEYLKIIYRGVVSCLSHKDFYEGVRAFVIEKDQNPKWTPATLSEVTSAMIDSYFAELPAYQQLKHKM